MSARRGPRTKHWCFTLNNYTPADVTRLSSPIAGVEYLIYGKEVGDSGTPHLQGFVSFQFRKYMCEVIQLLGQAHYSATRFLSQSITYCKKDGDFTEIGVPPQEEPRNEQGRRTDIKRFQESVREGIRDLKELRELHPDICAKYRRFVNDYILDHTPEIHVERFPLRPWQEKLNGKLILPPDNRKIIFVVDIVGNKGKSWFARYYCDLHDNAQIIIPGKKADMAFVVRQECKVFFFDCPRSKQGDFIQYDFLEELKNGYLFSPKYESAIKKLRTPHIVVLMNENPDMSKISQDRYDIMTIESD